MVINSRSASSFAPAGCRFPREVIAVAVRWYLRYGLSYRDVEELLAERGIVVDHVTVYRWVQTFTAEFIDAARPSRHAVGDRWFLDETYVKVAGRWTYFYRAIDQHGQVIDVLVSERRDGAAARAFFSRALTRGPAPVEVTTDRAPVYPRVLDDLVPGARHLLERYTTPWKLITAGSKHGFARCADPRRSARRARSSPATRSCRIYDAATTNSRPTPHSMIACRPRSPTSRTASKSSR
ncbi:MAG: transposase, family, partial [Mycobacterium sp.]|nr:transposase, family [Mycobacterium sp.]